MSRKAQAHAVCALLIETADCIRTYHLAWRSGTGLSTSLPQQCSGQVGKHCRCYAQVVTLLGCADERSPRASGPLDPAQTNNFEVSPDQEAKGVRCNIERCCRLCRCSLTHGGNCCACAAGRVRPQALRQGLPQDHRLQWLRAQHTSELEFAGLWWRNRQTRRAPEQRLRVAGRIELLACCQQERVLAREALRDCILL